MQISLPRFDKTNREARAEKREMMRENFAANLLQHGFKLSQVSFASTAS